MKKLELLAKLVLGVCFAFGTVAMVGCGAPADNGAEIEEGDMGYDGAEDGTDDTEEVEGEAEGGEAAEGEGGEAAEGEGGAEPAGDE